MIKPFKITRKHLNKYEELSTYDLGMYAIQVRVEQPLLVYETLQIAKKAYKYFEKMIETGQKKTYR
tara:strand:- start:897 stop:1094 length:198 start_codon:yes stop_codon:yes gene_type:complete